MTMREELCSRLVTDVRTSWLKEVGLSESREIGGAEAEMHWGCALKVMRHSRAQTVANYLRVEMQVHY